MSTLTLSSENARCEVFSFKDGLLAKLAHDLRLSIKKFEIKLSKVGTNYAFEGTFDTRSFQVECAQRGGQDDPSALSANDKKKIIGSLNNDVLKTSLYPNADIKGELAMGSDTGALSLTLSGKEGELNFEHAVDGDMRRFQTTIVQSAFGITPFKAAMGALKVKDTLRVELRISNHAWNEM